MRGYLSEYMPMAGEGVYSKTNSKISEGAIEKHEKKACVKMKLGCDEN